MLQFHRSSLMSSKCQTVVNTVNTVGVMGKGIAAEFKKQFPEMYLEYKAICDRGELGPGGFWLWKGKEQWVLNFATKKHWRSPSKIEYIENGLMRFRNQYEILGIREIAFPRLGCGNGGLDWNEVKPLMIRMLSDLPITVFINDFEKTIGEPDHHLPLMANCQPTGFDDFWNDVKKLVEERNGEFRAIFLDDMFKVTMNESGDLICNDDRRTLVAASEDLFRVWTLASDAPVSRFDLPLEAHENALKLISVLAELPYARAVNMASRKGRVSLALELSRYKKIEAIQPQARARAVATT